MRDSGTVRFGRSRMEHRQSSAPSVVLAPTTVANPPALAHDASIASRSPLGREASAGVVRLGAAERRRSPYIEGTAETCEV